MFPGHESYSRAEVVVIGGGLAGLISAVKLAKAGRSVILFEQSKQLGGRASTTSLAGIQFNLGPRALYCRGHAFRLLRELQVPFSGRIPSPGTSLGIYQGRQFRLPANLGDLLLSRLLTAGEKWRLVTFLRQLPTLDTAPLQRTSLRQWVLRQFGTGALASFLFSFFRLTSYADDREHHSAGAALDQLQIGLEGNVWYLDHGWQSLIDNTRRVAEACGVTVRSGTHVTSVRRTDDGVCVELRHGEPIHASAAVLAVAPLKVCALLNLPDDHRVVRWVQASRPISAACLDVALTKLPRPGHRFALGIDRPYYFSVHSAAARLGPEGVAVVHAMKYLGQEESPQATQQELEQFLDQVQPGWREHVWTRRYLPSMLVAPDLPQVEAGGLAGRPTADGAAIPGVFLAGDWIGARGQLADASAASAEDASQLALQFLQSHPQRQLQHA